MTDLSRRSLLLQSGAVLALAACSAQEAEQAAQPASPPAGDGALPPDVPVANWSRAEAIVNAIGQVEFPQVDFSIIDHGAVAGEENDARPAILAAIDACHEAGGGRVVLPEGLWRVDGPINLKSNVNLHLQEGAYLRFSPDPEFYLPVVFTRWEGTECYNVSPLFYTRGQENVAITGSGTIDGQGEAHWLPWRKNQRPTQRRLRDMGRDGVPVEDRVFGIEDQLRPHFIQFLECKRVLVEGVTLVDSPFWIVHPIYCEDVVVRGVTMVSRHINSDGVDPDSSKRILIEDCDFDVGDDGVAIKAGRDQDGWRVGRLSEEIVIRRCKYLGDTGGGVAIGSEMSGGVKTVFIEDFNLPAAHHALYFKANLDRGGLIEDVHIRNITTGKTDVLLIFTNDFHSYRGGNFPPRFENMTISDVTAEESRVGIHVLGHPDAPVRNIHLKDITVGKAEVPLELRDAENVVFDNVSVGGKLIDQDDGVAPDHEAFRP